jgi:anti-anti-sigma factor
VSASFEVQVTSRRPARFALIGEMDLAAMATCEELIEPACERRATVDLDLERVTFIDSSGLRTLMRLHRICDAAGGRLVLHHVPPRAARVLQACGLDQVLSIVSEAPLPG